MSDAPPVAGPPGEDERRRAALVAWWRRVAVGVALAIVLIVLVAGVVGNLVPSGGDVIGSPVPPPQPGITQTPVPSPSATDATGGDTGTGTGGDTGTGTGGDTGTGTGGAGTGGSTGGGGQGGGGQGGGGGGQGGGGQGGGGGGGSDPNVTLTPNPPPVGPTTPPPTVPPITPPPTPPPVVGPDRCTVPFGTPGIESCYTRQLATATITGGNLRLGLEGYEASGTGRAAQFLALAPSTTMMFSGLGGTLDPIVVSDSRGDSEGWTLTADISVYGGLPEGAQMSIDPWCARSFEDSAPGVHAGWSDQPIDEPVVLCAKDAQVGPNDSTSGIYVIGGQVTLSSWRGVELPVGGVLMTLTLA